MEFRAYTDPNAYWNSAKDALMSDELQNNLIISNIHRGMEPDADTSGWIMASVFDGSELALTGVCTPPFNIVVYFHDNRIDLNALELFIRNTGEFPGVLAESASSAAFADAYSKAHGNAYSLRHSMNLMRLDKINNDIKLAKGKFREINEGDLHYIPFWREQFYHDVNTSETQCVQEAYDKVLSQLGKHINFVWEDGAIPVSMAASGRKMINGAIINMVYTPPYFRGKGYAQACVTNLAKKLITNDAYAFAALYADTANPVSNRVYNKIGFKTQCVFDEINFK